MRRRLRQGLLLWLALAQSACFTLRYLGQQASGQLHLLRVRQRVADVLTDPRTPPELQARLRLAMEARQFGISVLGLRGGAEFTRYVDTGGPVAYNLTAAYRTRLQPHVWRFPLVGTVPYLGFFSRHDAEVEARRLQQAGHDVYLRPVEGYSTLGYLLSPIYAAMVSQPGTEGEVRTVETLLHEMAHTTAYIHSASALNESFATLVGVQGAALFFRSRGDAAMGRLVLQQAVEQEQAERAFAAWLRPVLTALKGLYARAHAAGWSEAETLRQRELFFADTMRSYRAAFPPGHRYRRLAEGPLNNAVLLSFSVYHSESHLQQDLLDSVDGDLRAYIDRYKQAQERSDGAEWLAQLAADYRATVILAPSAASGPRE